MKRFVLTIALLLTFQSFSQDSLSIDLQKRIYKIYLLDQDCKEQLRKYQNYEMDTSLLSLQHIEKLIHDTDSANYYELKTIIDEFGFPGYNLVGEDFSNSFWNMIQHQDNNLPFQKYALEKMKIEVDKNNASSTYFAY